MASTLLKLAAVLTGLGLLFAAGIVALMARFVLRPPRLTDGKALFHLHRLTPSDVGLRFEPQTFTVRDAARPGGTLHLAAWWIPAEMPSTRTAVLLHGFADAKVGAITRAPLLHQLGYHVLAIDLRAHGESGGLHSTAGFFERDDVDQVLNQLRATRSEKTATLVLVGLSLGAVVAAATAARRDDVSALVLDSIYADGGKVAAIHARRIGAPSGLLLRLALRLSGIMSGANYEAVRPLQLLHDVRCPMLLLLGGDDEFQDAEDVDALRRVVAEQAVRFPGSRLAVLEGAGHLAALETDPAWYTAAVAGFFERVAAASSDPV